MIFYSFCAIVFLGFQSKNVLSLSLPSFYVWHDEIVLSSVYFKRTHRSIYACNGKWKRERERGRRREGKKTMSHMSIWGQWHKSHRLRANNEKQKEKQRWQWHKEAINRKLSFKKTIPRERKLESDVCTLKSLNLSHFSNRNLNHCF